MLYKSADISKLFGNMASKYDNFREYTMHMNEDSQATNA